MTKSPAFRDVTSKRTFIASLPTMWNTSLEPKCSTRSNTPFPWLLGTCRGRRFSLFVLPFSLWSLDFPLPLPLKRKGSTSMGMGFTVMNFARAISVPQLLVGVQSRGVQHHVPPQRFLLQPVNEDAGLHKNRGWRSCWPSGMAKLVSASRSSGCPAPTTRCRSGRLP